MKKNYTLTFLLGLLALMSSYAQTAPPPDTLDAEVEVESEVEAEAETGKAAGSVAVTAGAGANFPNSLARIMISGGIAKGTEVPANETSPRIPKAENKKKSKEQKNVLADNNKNAQAVFDLAVAEVEVETEVEVEVENGAAVAVGGTAAGAAAVGASEYTIQGGGTDPALYPANTVTAVDAKTSTLVSLSPVTIDYPVATNATTIDGGSSPSTNRLANPENLNGAVKSVNRSNNTQSNNTQTNNPIVSNRMPLPYGIVYALETDTPISQVSTDTEAETEVEAEVEAEAETGAGGVAASAGTATIVAGDYAIVAAHVKVNTSASSSQVDVAEPSFFSIPEPSSNTAENAGSGNENATAPRNSNASSITNNNTESTNSLRRDATTLADVPDEVNGKGYSSFETEVESEVEAEVEAENGAAVAGVAGAGGGGANGQVSSAESVTSTSVSTSTATNNGISTLANDQKYEDQRRNAELTDGQPGAGAEAEGEATANASSQTTTATGNALGLGDAYALGTLFIEDVGASARTANTNETIKVESGKHYDFYTLAQRNWEGVIVANNMRNSNAIQDASLSESEAEVEAEAEAEVGFNSAAAAAITNATQAKNGIINFEAQAATSSSTATKVFDQPANIQNDNSTTIPATGLTYPDYSIDFSTYEYEAEVEVEVEAEVGFNSSAVAVSAAAGGYDGIEIKTQYQSHLHAAAGAAGAGKTVTTSIAMPMEGVAGNVTATAEATDDQDRGVAVAVAVAGVPNTPGADNEMEAEDEGLNFASVSVTIFTDPADVNTPSILSGYTATPQNGSSGNNETSTPQVGALGEVEVEAEAEAEAGYGVAAAAATSGATGIDAKSESFSQVSTAQYTGGYAFAFDALINESIALVSMGSSDAVLYWNGYGYDQFIVEQLNTTTGTYVQVGLVNRANTDMWEAYSFTISNLPEDEMQTFRITPDGNTSTAVILTITVPATLGNTEFENEQIIVAPYPNPVSDVLNIGVKFSENQEVEGTVYDVTGKLVATFNKNYVGNGSVQTLKWNVNRLSEGLYVLKISSQNNTKSFKILVQR